MERKQVMDILDKIQVYRQSFLVTPNLITEWSKILAPYDYEDVDKKLNDYFKDSNNFGRYPDVYYLIKYLNTSEEKTRLEGKYCKCQLCGRAIDLKNYSQHYQRCSSANYLCQMSLKYYGRKLNFEKLIISENEIFEKYYWEFCEKVIEKMDDGLEKHVLENSILTHAGYEPNYGLDELNIINPAN